MRKQNQEQDFGLNISSPKFTVSGKSLPSEFLLSLILAVTGVYGVLWCVISAFSLPVISSTLNIYTGIFVLLFTVIYHLKGVKNVIVILASLVYSIFIWYFKSAVAQGFIITINRIFKVYSKKTGLNFPTYIVSVNREQYYEFCTLFILFVSFIITYCICFSAVRKKSFWLTFLFTFPLFFSIIIFEITPNFIAVLMMFLCWTLLGLIRLSTVKTNSIGHKRIFNTAAVKIGLISVPVIIMSFALILTLFPQESYRQTANTEKMRDTIENIVRHNKLFSSNILSDDTKDVNLKDRGNIEFSGKTMLKIKSDSKYPLYLKGFSGSVYDGYGWKKLPDEDYGEINDKLYSMNVQNMSFYYLSLIGQQNSQRYKPFEIRVKNIGASKRCIYAPYNLRTQPQNIIGIKFNNDSFLSSDYIFGTSEYSLSAYAMEQGRPYSDIKGLLLNISEGKYKYSDRFNIFISDIGDVNKLSSEKDLKDYYNTSLNFAFSDFFNKEQLNFITAEQNYRRFMYEKYTQLPNGIYEKVSKLLKDENINKAPTSLNGIISNIKTYLKNNCTYTLSPGKTPEGRDFTDFFLFENQKGYCVHFATAATVMLRAAGIPARYVQGYVVSQDDYKTTDKDGWSDIKDNRAHAWTEVYYPGIGWQPIEMTPGGNTQNNFVQNNNLRSQPPVSSTPPAEKAESKTENKAESKPTVRTDNEQRNVDMNFRFSILPFFIFSAASIILIFIFLLIKRQIILSQRKKYFSLGDTNKAVIYVYNYIEKLLSFGGKISEEVNDIALKAKFSQHEISDEELKTVLQFAVNTANKNYKSLTHLKKFMFKYIKNLI